MATIFLRRPLLVSATVLSVAGAAYINTRSNPVRLDGAPAMPIKTLAFPATMFMSRQLTVTDVEQINHDTKRITFTLPGGKDEISGVGPGAAILTQHTPSGAWFPVLRPYTPVHDLSEPGILQLLVKKYPNGRASTHLHSLAPGSTLTVRGPLPGYTYTPSPTPRNVLLVAGGAGITPIYSLTKGILANVDDKTSVQLLWGVNGTRDIILRSELEALEQQYPGRLQVTYAVSGPEGKAEAPRLGDDAKWKKGYVDKVLLSEAIERCRTQGMWGDAKGTKVFVCGPPAMEDAVAGKKGALMELGLAKKEIHRF
nr:nadh-cytochrome b5 reductase 2 [Quercus suber]